MSIENPEISYWILYPVRSSCATCNKKALRRNERLFIRTLLPKESGSVYEKNVII